MRRHISGKNKNVAVGKGGVVIRSCQPTRSFNGLGMGWGETMEVTFVFIMAFSIIFLIEFSKLFS
jgi:hypothetical protein